ncbi:MAG TPA: hypothetical protein VFH66_12280 [Mycobacteriales bacterium]|nr:hypothetical protein [Mycobacteriales bacterium]
MKRSTAVLGATVGFALLYLGATIALGTPPKIDDSGAVVAHWFSQNGGHVRTWAWLLTLSSPLFALYAAFVRQRLPVGLRDLWLIGAVAFIAETALQSWIWLALAVHGRSISPGTARTLLDVADYWGPVLTSTTVMMLLPVLFAALGPEQMLPRWLGYLAAVAAAEQLVETLTIFGRNGFMAPGGPMNVFLGAGLVAVTLVALGVVVSRLERAPV